jgi:YegS/Rv2252/BmrU family lipid kinase
VIAIIVNPVAGGGRSDAARRRVRRAAAIGERAGGPAEVFVTERAGHARELARQAVGRGARLVVAWGGDGTISEVASELAFGETPLAIVAAGSGNGLARELGIAPEPERAIAEAVSAEPRRIDLGELAGRPFVNIAGVGFDAHVAARFNHPSNARRGLAGYASIAGRAMFSYQPARYWVTLADGTTVAIERGVLVSIANSAQYGNGARIAPGARVDDGLLDLVLVDERSRLRTICGLPRLFNDSVEKIGGCTIRRITRATIRSDRPMSFHLDGEPVQGGTELDVRVLPEALPVAVR